MPRVLNKKIHGVPPGAVLVDRTTKYGNPFTHLDLDKTKAKVRVATIEDAVRAFELWEMLSNVHPQNPFEVKEYLVWRKEFEKIVGVSLYSLVGMGVNGCATRKEAVYELAGRDLVCWCVDKDGNGPCHAKVWLKVANTVWDGQIRVRNEAPRISKSLKDVQVEDTGNRCQRCGAPAPDNRPFCNTCDGEAVSDM